MRKIIIGGYAPDRGDGLVRLYVVFRLTVPVGLRRQLAVGLRETNLDDYDADELADLKAGRIEEVVFEYALPVGETVASVAANATLRNILKADLITQFNAAQAALNARLPHQFFGVSWDGTNWTV